jgi:MFS transporter, ACS family, hexuronate transporter
MSQKGLWTYENGLMLILGLSFGFAFFDRNAVSLLAPYIVRDLRINNTQVGMLSSALSLSWAVSAFVIGRWSDAAGVRKPFLIGILLVFSFCSILSGLATSFPLLLASRLIMGIAEGPLMPICLAIIAVESAPQRRGLNVGIVQSVFASLLGAAIAPLVLVRLAEWFNWRIAFFLAGVPGILCAVAVLLWVREPQAAPVIEKKSSAHAGRGGLTLLFGERNIWLCAAIACLMISWLMLHQNFLPLFLTTVRGLSSEQMSQVMSITGVCAMIVGFLGAAVSDRLGRKPVVIGACLISLVTPLTGLYFGGPIPFLAALMFIGWIGTAAFALFMAVIPGETVPARYAATASGLVVGIGEVVGGSCSPLLGGWMADQTTLAAPIKFAAVCAIGGTILALFLKETAPVKIGAPSPKEHATLEV